MTFAHKEFLCRLAEDANALFAWADERGMTRDQLLDAMSYALGFAITTKAIGQEDVMNAMEIGRLRARLASMTLDQIATMMGAQNETTA